MKLKYLSGASSIQLNTQKCVGCGMCLEVCPHEVLCLRDNRIFLADHDSCMECGACAMNCPADAITLSPGVGCAAAIIAGWIKGTEPTCGCSDHPSTGCC